MHFDLDQRTASLSVGEFADFTLGPRDALGGPAGLWRAQLGTHWHNQLRDHAASDHPGARFEVPVTGKIFHRGWTLTLTGRIDQILPDAAAGGEVAGDKGQVARNETRDGDAHASAVPRAATLREIKTVTRALPADESELRADYPAYFVQIAAYVELLRRPADEATADSGDAHLSRPSTPRASSSSLRGELHFVEVASGLAQTVPLAPADDNRFRAQLERVTEFLDLRHRARERLRHLRFRPPFPTLRPGQETTQADLAAALAAHPIVFFEAPTGFGKTGALLHLALGQLRAGRFDRVLYLTSKATGQLQVMRTLRDMTESSPPFNAECETPSATSAPAGDAVSAGAVAPHSAIRNPQSAFPPAPVTAWLVRPKREHCIHHTYHCTRDACPYLSELETRWARSGLARFYLLENEPRDLAALRAAGREASICPYEITRAALPFNDLWIGDYNYVFSPAHNRVFLDQPTFDPARTLLLIDEAHNLPSRVADVYSHALDADTAAAVSAWLHRTRAPAALANAWDHLSHYLSRLPRADSLSLADEDDARHLLETLAPLITGTPLDTEQIPADIAEHLWQIPALADELARIDLPRLWWSPRHAALVITCLDPAPVIGPALRQFGAVILASATLSPADVFAETCGLLEEGGLRKTDCEIVQKAPHPADIASHPSVASAPSVPLPFPSPSASAAGAAAPNIQNRLGSLTKRDTKKLFAQLTTGAKLLHAAETRHALAPCHVRAATPWRDRAYDIAIDLRADTTYQQRARHAPLTAAAIAALCAASPSAPVAIFFPSYAYAEHIKTALDSANSAFRTPHSAFLQPRLPDLAAQNAWLENALADHPGGALFLVLGSSFAEGIDLLGGRITHAMVVGPALPEVNPVQRARLAEHTRVLGREAAARRVYQIPGIQKVNQALGRLVRAPGQRVRALLHCRRFAEPGYHELLAPDYQTTRHLATDDDLAAWLHTESES
ncbi:helicase [Termitidicoccus mucosus]|uniref:helicase C-terminal domain-containing protein n=2 Tax=Termitidicoccus mucosus TaxID=1184151 RepID=UPI0031841A44